MINRKHSVRRSSPRGSLRKQAGIMLIEAMVGTLVFAIGLIALIKLQAEGIRLTTESKARADASFLADKVAGDLATQNLQTGAAAASNLITDYDGVYTATSQTGIGGSADVNIYGTWQTMLVRTLPTGSLNIAIESSADPLNPTTNQVRAATVTVNWTTSSGVLRTFSQFSRLVD